ncbi:MAG: serine dehydratase beta chain [Woeseiaceae bacterium]|nr:serine dehydratase beta chain [Woeseiaceae bacterium]
MAETGVFDIFNTGVGPIQFGHTVGPMEAARQFADAAAARGEAIARIDVRL